MSQLDWKGRGELENPCYDTKTKTDCPRRCGGCQLNCPEWKAYEVKRAELYRKRTVQYQANSVIEENKFDAHAKFVKKRERIRRIYR